MQSIKDIKQLFEQAEKEQWNALFPQYKTDERAGVQKLITQYENKLLKHKKEQERLYRMLEFERKYGDEFSCICGIDEAGRGPFAGPVVAGAVILPKGLTIEGLNDSKQVSAKKREELYDEIKEKAVSVGIGMSSPARIDEINILQATYEAMREAISKLSVKPDILLNDAVRIPGLFLQQVPIVKGDAKSVSIAAASIIAKVTRDRLMMEYDKAMPQYHFAANKGYGSAEHIEALAVYGASPIHRRSFITHFKVKE